MYPFPCAVQAKSRKMQAPRATVRHGDSLKRCGPPNLQYFRSRDCQSPTEAASSLPETWDWVGVGQTSEKQAWRSINQSIKRIDHSLTSKCSFSTKQEHNTSTSSLTILNDPDISILDHHHHDLSTSSPTNQLRRPQPYLTTITLVLTAAAAQQQEPTIMSSPQTPEAAHIAPGDTVAPTTSQQPTPYAPMSTS